MAHPLQSLSFQSLFDAVADAMLLITDTGIITEANAAALSLLGYTAKEIAGLKVEVLVPERYRAQHLKHRTKFIRNPEKRPMGSGNELSVLTKDGKELEVDIGLSPISYQEKSYTLVTFYTVAKRKSVEQALRISEESLRLAKKAAGLVAFDFDADLKMRDTNEQLLAYWGAEQANIEQKSEKIDIVAVPIIHPEDSAIRASAIRHATDPGGNGELKVEYRIINPVTGDLRWVSATGRAHFRDGHATRLLGVVRDITEQKILEKKLQDQHAETETLFAKEVATQTASAIAHEINQPLTAISAYSEVALHALKQKVIDSVSLKRALEGCVAQAQRAGSSLHELLSFLHKGEMTREQLDVNNVVKEALVIAKSYGYSDFHPVLELESNIKPVLGNKTQVLKILVNLLRNAVEAMREAEIASSEISITVRTNANINMAHVSVQDVGPGLNYEVAKHIFEPFFTTKPKGIGMGLAISRSLAEANGGQLWLDPDAKLGATFHFTLPFAP
ncbi:PAS domain-containing sensor histidine kinase [Methylotenera mobilis]|uniref:histidine kinase n=1 Tax=Methylotenera mobilis (strain JLW8 / ATCC BAA-1282 / DSM 17540) TaxID=583345 RepID=C6WWL2_METML|nr:PAS domain-containing sensor histidine kinase [Methylotenera mobilis]ACT48311.1 PAS/PAC sensor signal transduction histidine kinase [Methylotenera mobilis JLW8]